MTLREKQTTFAFLLADLLLHIKAEGYEATLGEVYRPPSIARAGGSLHTKRLACDINLFKNGAWLKTTEAHRPFGEYWELQSTDEYRCCWGGRWGDGNHYSIADGGLK